VSESDPCDTRDTCDTALSQILSQQEVSTPIFSPGKFSAEPGPCPNCGSAYFWIDCYQHQPHCSGCEGPPSNSMIDRVVTVLLIAGRFQFRIVAFREVEHSGTGQDSQTGMKAVAAEWDAKLKQSSETLDQWKFRVAKEERRKALQDSRTNERPSTIVPETTSAAPPRRQVSSTPDDSRRQRRRRRASSDRDRPLLGGNLGGKVS
jgi:hypothetical protein